MPLMLAMLVATRCWRRSSLPRLAFGGRPDISSGARIFFRQRGLALLEMFPVAAVAEDIARDARFARSLLVMAPATPGGVSPGRRRIRHCRQPPARVSCHGDVCVSDDVPAADFGQ